MFTRVIKVERTFSKTPPFATHVGSVRDQFKTTESSVWFYFTLGITIKWLANMSTAGYRTMNLFPNIIKWAGPKIWRETSGVKRSSDVITFHKLRGAYLWEEYSSADRKFPNQATRTKSSPKSEFSYLTIPSFPVFLKLKSLTSVAFSKTMKDNIPRGNAQKA